mgnify:CR=1 FL=1
MSCATYALAYFITDKLLASFHYESAIFALANSFLKSLKESIFNTRIVLPYFDQTQGFQCLFDVQSIAIQFIFIL